MILMIPWTDQGIDKKVPKKISTERTLVPRIRKIAQVPWLHNEERGLGKPDPSRIY